MLELMTMLLPMNLKLVYYIAQVLEIEVLFESCL